MEAVWTVRSYITDLQTFIINDNNHQDNAEWREWKEVRKSHDLHLLAV